MTPTLLWICISGIVAASFYCEKKKRWGKAIGATLLCVIGGTILGNMPFTPSTDSSYDFIYSTITYLAIVWLLLGVNLASIIKHGKQLIGLFLMACICTILGAIISCLLFQEYLPDLAAPLAGVGVLIGLAMYLPFSITLGYGIGCLTQMGLQKKFGHAFCEHKLVPLAAGLIVGEALTGMGHAAFEIIQSMGG